MLSIIALILQVVYLAVQIRSSTCSGWAPVGSPYWKYQARLKLSDDKYRRGTVTEDGKEVSLTTLNNGGIVSLNDAKNPTHWQVHEPEAVPRDQPYQTPHVNTSRLNRY
jgi:hypothetical protein